MSKVRAVTIHTTVKKFFKKLYFWTNCDQKTTFITPWKPKTSCAAGFSATTYQFLSAVQCVFWGPTTVQNFGFFGPTYSELQTFLTWPRCHKTARSTTCYIPKFAPWPALTRSVEILKIGSFLAKLWVKNHFWHVRFMIFDGFWPVAPRQDLRPPLFWPGIHSRHPPLYAHQILDFSGEGIPRYKLPVVSTWPRVFLDSGVRAKPGMRKSFWELRVTIAD